MNIHSHRAPLALATMLLLVLAGANSAHAQDAMSLEKAAQKSNNPVSDAWLLITQNDYTAIEGDATGGGHEMQERLSFKPVMLIPIRGGDWNLVNRVVVQAFSAPRNKDLTSPPILLSSARSIATTTPAILF